MKTVAELMKDTFDISRDPRSPEYKAGTKAALDFRINDLEIKNPYSPATAQADAFSAGIIEGHDVWRRELFISKAAL